MSADFDELPLSEEPLEAEVSLDDFAVESEADDPPLADVPPSCFDAESLFPFEEPLPALA